MNSRYIQLKSVNSIAMFDCGDDWEEIQKGIQTSLSYLPSLQHHQARARPTKTINKHPILCTLPETTSKRP